MSRLIALPFALPLLMAAVAAIFARRRGVQRALALLGGATLVGCGITFAWWTGDGGTVATQIGGWPPPFAIPLAADLFSSLMLVVAGLMVIAGVWFAASSGQDDQPLFHPLTLVLAAGIAAAFLTADLFNLFVSFEVMLIASYVLLSLGGGKQRLRAATVYVTSNLFASTLLVAGVALAYATTGSVHFAELREAAGTGALVVPGALLLVAFGVKGSLVPIHGWLPRAYPATSPAVAALFSGLLTKVGIYAMYRVYAIVFAGDPAFRTTLLWIASATMLVGVLGAIGRTSMREILSFHIVSQVGYMVMGLGLFDLVGLAGGIFYILHHIVVKTSLFLTAAAVGTIEGTDRLDRLGGLARERPFLAAGFAVSALSLAGLPPLSGFTAKLILLRSAFAGGDHVVAAVALGVGLLTLMSMLKIWSAVFWGEHPAGGPRPSTRPATLAGPAIALALISIAIGLGSEGLYVLTERAGDALLDPSRYLEAVTSP